MLLFSFSSSTFPPQTPLPNNQSIINNNNKSYHSVTSRSLCHVSYNGDEYNEESMVSSAAAIAATIRGASTSPVEFVQSVDKASIVLPSQDFQRLSLQQLHLFRRIVHPHALLSVYVRPAGSYVMDRLELRRITLYPDVHPSDILVLVANFTIAAGLRVAEATISNQQAEFFPEFGAVVFPLVTRPFVVGFLVAELPKGDLEREQYDIQGNPFSRKSFTLPNIKEPQSLNDQNYNNHSDDMLKFNREQRQNAMSITRSLALAYVMDQKAMLVQQSAWQNNVRMNNLVGQIRDSLSSIQTLSKMVSVHMKRSEVSYDIVEDILVQGDRMRDTLQQLQDAVYLTKANIMHYNNDAIKKTHESDGAHTSPMSSKLSGSLSAQTLTSEVPESRISHTSSSKDIEFPMPPPALAPSQPGIRKPCLVSDVLDDLVGAIKPLAEKQRRTVELCDLSGSLLVAVEEPALRQALSNLIEGALLRSKIRGRVDIVCSVAPAGGALLIIDDDGPDMHYMTQMHSLMPFGADLCGENRMEDNVTWNFIAGLTVAREILENYGCVVRVFSPKNTDAAIGAGGTRIELWLPSFAATPSDADNLLA